MEYIEKAEQIYKENFSNEVYFERSIFTNWTCAIADCKYCYLSTKPKHKPVGETKALRSKESILAEVLLCKIMGWKVGYITGGLRVESVSYLSELLEMIKKVDKKTMMNYGPYSLPIIQQLKPHLLGMGSAIESFDEKLHNYICPSKPLKSLLAFLENLEKENLQKLITIILGLGEKKRDVFKVIENIKKYKINTVQLCFLKPQENTIFSSVPSPDMQYMAYWVAKIRIACPKLIIKIALVRDRIDDFSLLLRAGVNNFSRFMIFKDFGNEYAQKLQNECRKAGRELKGHFISLPEIDFEQEVKNLPFSDEIKEKILEKSLQYFNKLQKQIKP